MIVECSFTRKRVSYRVVLQTSTSMEMCLSTFSLPMGPHVTIFFLAIFCCLKFETSFATRRDCLYQYFMLSSEEGNRKGFRNGVV
jgi:hypothetical protein